MCIVPHVPPPPPKNFTPCGSLRCRPQNLIMDDFPDILAGSIDDAMEDMDDVLQDNCGDGGFGGVRGVVGVVVLSSGVGGAWEVWGGRSVHMLAYIRYIQLLNDDLEA